MTKSCLAVISPLVLSVFFCSPLFADDAIPENFPVNTIEDEEYKLGSGDLIKITVFNQKELSGEYMINGAGLIALPLIGDVKTKDLTVKQVEEGIANKLKPDYLESTQKQ